VLYLRVSGDEGQGVVGRAGELAGLERACRESLAGRGTAVCVVGPAGIGKSRLLRAATQRAAALGMVSLGTWCWAEGAPCRWRRPSP
jgi:hypothetical protein